MTISDAVKIFNKKYPTLKVIGYWENGDNYIVCIKLDKSFIETPMAGQYIIKQNGQIIPTNPVLSDISEKTMKHYKG